MAAIQSSFLLGLLHGVNPCGHSWLVLAPFTTGVKNGKRVAVLTGSFVLGTALACLVLGATLGTISSFVPTEFGLWIEVATSAVLIVIGVLLIYNPHLLHHHDHDHDHSHNHGHEDGNKHHHSQHNHHCDCDHHSGQHSPTMMGKIKNLTKSQKMLPFGLFCIGFINMVIPCPTAAIMYGYALNSGSAMSATIVFGTYAVSTAIAVGGVIFLIFKATKMASSLQKEWVEPLIMRLAGFVIIVFSGYGLYQSLVA